ncbi:MAG: polyprenyl synthetase family protein [Candidatus Thermoplasmatota archaeon]|nr:polyprenyl synthetase family protein [Candidatus Thermoplasmatota archaeon]
MNSLQEWEKSLHGKIDSINRSLLEAVDCEEENLREMARYTIEAGGKRLRPILTILSHSIVSEEPYEKIMDLAIGTELVHTASLIHDDIIDAATTRRGLITLSEKYGVFNAIVVGDYLFTRAYELGSRYGPEVSKILAHGAIKLAEGQTLEFVNLGNLNMPEEVYLKIISNKTASFFSVCSEGAAIAAGSNYEVRKSLSDFAFNMGMAFQITDDILDIMGEEKSIGKTVFADIKHNAITLPIIYTLRSDERYAERLKKILKEGFVGNSKEDLRNLFVESGSIDQSFRKAKRYVMDSIDALHRTGKSPNLDTLMDLSMVVIQRLDDLF